MRADIVIAGLGPSGRALAHRCAQRGLRVTAVDRHPHRTWTPTYGAWADELPPWVSLAAIAAIAEKPRAYGTTEWTIDRSYVVFDTAALHQSLSLVGVNVVAGKVTAVEKNHVTLADGTRVEGGVVIDARGVAATLSRPQQTAYGVTVSLKQAAPVLGGRSAWFMDWRPSPGAGAGARFAGALPSFLYAVPLGGGLVLLEETCLVGQPPLSMGELRRRLTARLRAHGVELTGDEPTERVRFAVHAPQKHARGVLSVGARGGIVHPATGYSVAASLNAAESIADALSTGADPYRALWPRRSRTVQALRVSGLTSLLRLPHEALPPFFDAFFALPSDLQRAYLSDRSALTGLTEAMTRIFGASPTATKLRLAAAVMHSL